MAAHASHDDGHSQQETIAPTEFVCPLTLEVMRDPVVSRYGQSYEREAILQWLASGNVTCPMTRQPLRMSNLITNQQLRLKIRRWQLENGLDINLVTDAPDDDTSRIFGYFTIPQKHEDNAERSHDDPVVIVERARSSGEHVRRSRRHGVTVPTSRPQRGVKRAGFLSCLLPHRAVAA